MLRSSTDLQPGQPYAIISLSWKLRDHYKTFLLKSVGENQSCFINKFCLFFCVLIILNSKRLMHCEAKKCLSFVFPLLLFIMTVIVLMIILAPLIFMWLLQSPCWLITFLLWLIFAFCLCLQYASPLFNSLHIISIFNYFVCALFLLTSYNLQCLNWYIRAGILWTL